MLPGAFRDWRTEQRSIFCDDQSSDGTSDEVRRVRSIYPGNRHLVFHLTEELPA
jgi:hypothetical protein